MPDSAFKTAGLVEFLDSEPPAPSNDLAEITAVAMSLFKVDTETNEEELVETLKTRLQQYKEEINQEGMDELNPTYLTLAAQIKDIENTLQVYDVFKKEDSCKTTPKEVSKK